jgi:DNA-binding response OmpR family regulator
MPPFSSPTPTIAVADPALPAISDRLRPNTPAPPRVVTIDWDAPEIDGAAACIAARQRGAAVLVTMKSPEHAPAAIKAGCHGILLSPFDPNLLAARIGRLTRQLPLVLPTLRGIVPQRQITGTNRVWPEARCPSCDEPGAVSFEFSSYRRMWYACLTCDHVWLGPRRE